MLADLRKSEILRKYAMCGCAPHTSPMPPMAAMHKGDYMAAQNTKRLNAHSQKLLGMIHPGVELPDWAEQKLTLAADYVQSVCNHLMYGDKRPNLAPSRRIIIMKKVGLG